MNGTVVAKNGKLYIREEDVMWDQPKRQALYWPTGVEERYFGHLAGETSRYIRDGRYRLSNGVEINLINNGATTPDTSLTEITPIKPPRKVAGYDWNWRNGEWHKDYIGH